MKTLIVVMLLCTATAQTIKAPTKAHYNAAAVAGAKAVRDAMNDPDSFRVSEVEVVASKDPFEPLVCLEGRTKNGRGGYVKMRAVARAFIAEESKVHVLAALEAAAKDAEDLNATSEELHADLAIENVCNSGHWLLEGDAVLAVVKAALKADRDK